MRFVLIAVVVLLAVAILPTASAGPSHAVGTATRCTSTVSCSYTINGSSGIGWAYTGYNSISFRLPGEGNATYGGAYSVHSIAVNGSVYDMQGSFLVTDVNTGKIVTGATNTNISVTVYCHYKGCTYTYKLINGTIAFRATHFDATSTTFSCSPSSIKAQHSTSCTVTVKDLANSSVNPSGNVSMQTRIAGVGHFANKGACTLSNGTCTLKFTTTDEFVGTATLYANYHGTPAYYKSQGTAFVYVS
jgi:hypothetical protein